MADPVMHHYPTNPCRQCTGPRSVIEASWRDPRCWVSCDQCGNSAGANTIAEALTAWNDANPAAKGPTSASAV